MKTQADGIRLAQLRKLRDDILAVYERAEQLGLKDVAEFLGAAEWEANVEIQKIRNGEWRADRAKEVRS